FRLLLMLAIGLAALPSARAEDLSDADKAASVAAIAAAKTGDWNGAYAAASRSTNPLPSKIVRWLDFTRSPATGRFNDISAFIQQNPDWPGQKIRRRQVETALASKNDDPASGWSAKFPPVTPMGKARAAAVVMARGQNDAGLAALRQAWIDGDF